MSTRVLRTSLILSTIFIASFGCRKTDDATPPADEVQAGSPCEVADCGPALGMPMTDCGDGTMAGPTGQCLRDADGSCGWEVRECANPGDDDPGAQAIVGEGCQVGGCSQTLCTAAGDDAVSTCEWREEYACYRSAECKVQTDGACGWTQTEALSACIASARAAEGAG